MAKSIVFAKVSQLGVKLNDYDQTERGRLWAWVSFQNCFQKVVLTVRTENFSETILDRFFFQSTFRYELD